MSGNEDPFVTDFQRYVYVSKYSRYLHDLNRRETWSETVSRYFDFFEKHLREKHGYELTPELRSELSDAVYSLNVMPSMRCIMTAGPALEKANQGGFNCAYQVVDSPRVFSEIMFTLLCGTGVGFSVERQHVNKLPETPEQFFPTDTTIVVADSKIGWAKALNELIQLLYTGCIPKWDVSKIRPAGSVLKTFGGRASGPEALVKSFQFIVKIFKEAAGRKLTSLECHDIVCVVGESVVVGGVRRSALISLSNLSDERMRSAKTGQWWTITPWRSLANNSAVYTDKRPSMDIFMAEWKSLYDSKSGERGIFSRYAARSVIERSNQFRKDHFSGVDGIRYREVDHEWGCNPCFTGDTLVAVADERKFVSFKELAKIGEDVRVFCLDDRGIPIVSTMRRPKRTLIKAPIYRILLDDGNSVRQTANHSFFLTDGRKKTVSELKPGDSLRTLTRWETRLNKTSSKYRFSRCSGIVRAEHRMIAEYDQDVSLFQNSDRLVVHHRDFNSLNNSPKNLEIMTPEEHDALHTQYKFGCDNPIHRVIGDPEKRRKFIENLSKSLSGVSNPRYSGVSNEDLKKYALVLVKTLGRRANSSEWKIFAKEHGLPQTFSGWRKTHLGGVNGFLNWAAEECGFISHIGVDPHILNRYDRYLEHGYDCFISDGKIFFNKVCEFSGEKFISPFPEKSVKEEYSAQYRSMVQKKAWKKNREKNILALRASFKNLKFKKREDQAQVYNDLKFRLQRVPLKAEWKKECQKNYVSPEISRQTSPFRSWNDLKEYASTSNHKVVSVEFDGYEDVYNGTVDTYHNYFVGAFEGENGKTVSLHSGNCSEILLRDRECCNLSEVVIRPTDTIDDVDRKVRVAAIFGTFQSTLTDFKFVSKKWRDNMEDERLLGVSLTGIMDNKLTSGKLGKEKLIEALTRWRKTAIRTNLEFSKQLKIPSATACTATKPSGTVSSLVDSAAGIHARHSEYYIRTVRSDKKDPLTQLMIDEGIPYEDDVMRPESTTVFSFPQRSPKTAIFREDLSAIDQLETWLTYQLYWCDHKPSVTVSVKEHEWLDVGAWVYRNFEWVSGISFLPYADHSYKQAPYQECTREEYEAAVRKMPSRIRWERLVDYEKTDSTTGSRELSCAAGGCDIN